jgi:phage gp29-like protein
VYPADVLAQGLAKFHNSSYIVTTNGDEIIPIHVTSDGNVFLLAYDAQDRRITKTVLYQTLATEQAEHMARAASDTHQDVLDLVFSWDKEGLETTMDRESLTVMVALNWGDAIAATHTPRFNLPRVAHQDLNEVRKALAALESSGYLHRSQYTGTDQQADLPARDPQQVEEDYQRGLAAADAAAQSAAQQSAKTVGKEDKNRTQEEGGNA